MDNVFFQQTILGAKPMLVDAKIHPLIQQADNGDINAVFELSRHFYANENFEDDLDGALFYKSLLVENFPEERDPYTCAVTLMEIGMIYAEKAMREESLKWFKKTYEFIKENYTANRRMYLMIKIGFFDYVVECGFYMNEIIEDAFE